jgi:hypothetical protein
MHYGTWTEQNSTALINLFNKRILNADVERNNEPICKTISLTTVTRNGKIVMILGSKVRPVSRAENLTTICEPIV